MAAASVRPASNSVAAVSGFGTTFSVTSVSTESVPKAPHCSLHRS